MSRVTRAGIVKDQSVRMWARNPLASHPANVFEVDLARVNDASYIRVERMGKSSRRLVVKIAGEHVTAWWNNEGNTLDDVSGGVISIGTPVETG